MLPFISYNTKRDLIDISRFKELFGNDDILFIAEITGLVRILSFHGRNGLSLTLHLNYKFMITRIFFSQYND